MAHLKYTDEQLQNHFDRWVKIRGKLTMSFLRKLLAKNPDFNKGRVSNVARGRAFDFVILEAFEALVKKERESLLKRHKLVARS